MMRFLFSLLVLAGLVVVLSSQLSFGDTTLPPLGKFLSPSHGFWRNAEGRMEDVIALRFNGVQDEVFVEVDAKGVPHVFTANNTDLYFAQGYLTARDRLWQLDISTRASAGRIAEVLGEDLLAYDKSQRNLGMGWAAENSEEKWRQDSMSWKFLTAYTEGINAYIRTLKPRDYPLEFKLLNYAPEEWTPIKCGQFLKSMASTLCFSEYDLEYTTLYQILGREKFDFLFPNGNPAQDPIIPPETPWQFEPVAESTADESTRSIGSVLDRRGMVLKQHDDVMVGSNNWALSGTRTASGKPILCNDPHLTLSLPSIWYEIHLNSPSQNVYGASLPGMPGVIIGFNEHIAWGATNVGHDMLDWYEIQWVDSAKTQYMLDGAPRNVTYRYEEIQVGKKTVIDTVTYTYWGPVQKTGAYEGLAMRWLAHQSADATDATVFVNINQAKNFQDFTAALDMYHTPAQNFVFADVRGNIGLRIAGALPLRQEGEGRLVSDGSQTANGYLRTIPPSHNPVTYNPARGFVASANQKTTNDTYPYYYSGGPYFEDYRGRVLNRYLSNMRNATYREMQALQYDSYSLKAEEILPTMLNVIKDADKSTQQEEVYMDLLLWDMRYEADSRGAMIFDKWYRNMYLNIWDEFNTLPDSLIFTMPESWRTIDLIRTQPDNEAFDVDSTQQVENMPDVVWNTFIATCDELAESDVNSWAEMRPTQIQHLASIPGLNEEVSVAGHGDVLNATSTRNGPSWRMIVELDDPIIAYVVYPGGQSGNPGSPFYDNMIDHWTEGRYYVALFPKAPGEIASVQSLTMEHKGK